MESNGNVIQLPTPAGVARGPGRPKKKEDDDGEAWLVSYADMMTLLFCFLVILLSVSRIDVAKMSGLKQEMDKQFSENAAPQKSLEDMEQELTAAVSRAGLSDQVKVRSTERGLILDLNAQVLFKPGSAELNLRAMDLLDRVLAPLAAEPLQVMVEGHTDPLPIKSPLYPSNWELSAARASTVVRYMITALSFRPNRLAATGFGDTRPLGPTGELLEEASAVRLLDGGVSGSAAAGHVGRDSAAGGIHQKGDSQSGGWSSRLAGSGSRFSHTRRSWNHRFSRSRSGVARNGPRSSSGGNGWSSCRNCARNDARNDARNGRPPTHGCQPGCPHGSISSLPSRRWHGLASRRRRWSWQLAALRRSSSGCRLALRSGNPGGTSQDWPPQKEGQTAGNG